MATSNIWLAKIALTLAFIILLSYMVGYDLMGAIGINYNWIH